MQSHMDRVMLLLMSMRLLDRADEPGRHLLVDVGDTPHVVATPRMRSDLAEGPTTFHHLCKMQVVKSGPCKAA